MINTTLNSTNKEREIESSPPSDNGRSTAAVLEVEEPSESSGLPRINNDNQTEKTPVKLGLSLAPMENLISSVNEHLKDCKWCKGHKLVLKKDRRIGLAQNYKLSCASCEKKDLGLRQKIFYLRRVADGVGCYQKRRKLMLEINRNVRKINKRRTERAGRYITSPLKNNIERELLKIWT